MFIIRGIFLIRQLHFSITFGTKDGNKMAECYLKFLRRPARCAIVTAIRFARLPE